MTPVKTYDKHKTARVLLLGFCLAVGIALFWFWVGYPGLFNRDIPIHYDNTVFGWHPPFLTVVIKGLRIVWGEHSWYFFLLNNLMFFTGVWIFFTTFYLRYKSLKAFILFPFLFLGDLILPLPSMCNNILLASFLFLLYGMVFFYIGVPHKYSRLIGWSVFLLACIGTLLRQTAIFSVAPVAFILVYYNAQLKQRHWFWGFVSLFGILTAFVSVAILIPRLLCADKLHPEQHILLHQMSGACVPAGDSSCFRTEWYEKGKDFQQLVHLYYAQPLDADPLSAPWRKNRIFKTGLNIRVIHDWLPALMKYPRNFWEHEKRFWRAFFDTTGPFQQRIGINEQIAKSQIELMPDISAWKQKQFPENEWNVQMSPIRQTIYDTINFHWPAIGRWYVLGMLLELFVLSGLALFRHRNVLLAFIFGTSGAGLATLFINIFFVPVPLLRYVIPSVYLMVIACIGCLALGIDVCRMVWKKKKERCTFLLTKHKKNGKNIPVAGG